MDSGLGKVPERFTDSTLPQASPFNDWDAVEKLTQEQLLSFAKIIIRVPSDVQNPAAYALRWVQENKATTVRT